MLRPTCDLHQRMKISATILKSSVESATGCFSHLDLVETKTRSTNIFFMAAKLVDSGSDC